ncbi:hypothetical protein [Tianweitania sediminis]|uniref:Uncharacterized protein n=1 Tax=Tianweitania sediminis TaxID=1502156 RepID=A0A8J7UHE8_9HYPH|nr:hypothetical protein [Tianweitania sediminis]MBP0439114.1 hypothetical protein [Tianweitania sediminis]
MKATEAATVAHFREEDGGRLLRFLVRLSDETAHKYGIKHDIIMRIGSDVPVRDSWIGNVGIYWDVPGGSVGAPFSGSYDGHLIETYCLGNGVELADDLIGTVLMMLERAHGKRKS